MFLIYAEAIVLFLTLATFTLMTACIYYAEFYEEREVFDDEDI